MSQEFVKVANYEMLLETGGLYVEESQAGCPTTGHEVRPLAKEDAETETAETGRQEEVKVFKIPQAGYQDHHLGDQIESITINYR
jgi:hypothetical protein